MSVSPHSFFENVAAMRTTEWKDKSGYTYGLHGTPTTFLLEERLCALEGGLRCVLLPSGLAAIANVSMALLWLWVVDGVRPTWTDWLGVSVCVLGACIIIFGSRQA